jgi:outer membrane protein TolC
MEIERRRVQELTDGFQRDLNRIRAGQGRPIEVLNQAKRLVAARQRLLEALIAFDRAQFQLFVALGQPPTLAVEEDKPPPPAGAMLPPAN